MILRLLRALRRLVSRRARPVDRGEWVEASVALAAWHGQLSKVLVVKFSADQLDQACSMLNAEQQKDADPLDAIAARFDAAVDEAAKGRNVPPSA